MKALKTVKRIIGDFGRTPHLLEEIREGLANQSELLNRKLQEIIEGNGPRSLGELDRAPHGPALGAAGELNQTIAALSDIPYAKVNLSTPRNPIEGLVSLAEFAHTERYFSDNPPAARSLVSAPTHALPYPFAPNLAPTPLT